MAASPIPHLVNDLGVAKVAIGVKEFQCMGARPPFDHPHVFLDMGAASEALCPYCATLFVYDASLHGAADPAECVYEPAEPVAAAS